jgi:flagellar assembly factor FliW
VNIVSDIILKGKIIGFEECGNFSLQDAFGEGSPFRLLSCNDSPLSLVVVNPYDMVDDYSFEIEESTLKSLFSDANYMEDIAVLCVVRPDESALYVNLRSPVIVNTKRGTFVQIILQSEAYGVSVPLMAKKAG